MKFIKDTLKTTFWNTISKSLGFLVPFFIAAWFGASSETDAFFFSYGLILFISSIFSCCLQNVIVPYISETRSKEKDVGIFLGSIISNISIFLLIIIPLTLLLIKPLLPVITRFNIQEQKLVFHVLLETSPLIFLLIWSSILSGALNAYKKYFYPALTPAFRAIINLIIIFTLRSKIGIHSIAMGYLFGEIIRLLIFLIVIRKLNLFSIKLNINFHSDFISFIKISLFSVISIAATEINLMVDKIMASWLEAGSVSILYYADRLYMIPITFLSTGVFVTSLSYWSEKYYISKSKSALYKDILHIGKITTLIALTLSLILILVSPFLVKIAFGRGKFALDKLPAVKMTFIFYIIGLAPYTLRQIYIRGLLVIKKTKIIMIYAVITILFNILFNYLFMFKYGVSGIALSTSLVGFLSLFYFHKILTKLLN